MIRIFIGCAANHEDAESQAVLEYSIAKHATEDFEITWMKLSRDPASPYYCDPQRNAGWVTDQWATPFSGFRWIVPELCGFEGRAIYMDSDVIVLADIADLWHQDFMANKTVIAKADVPWRFCVSLWDCRRAERLAIPLEKLRRLPDGHRQMTQRYSKAQHLVQSFDGNWNCLDGEGYADLSDPDIKALHYTSMRHQPQLRYAVARLAGEGRKHWFDGSPTEHWRPDVQALFDKYLEEAYENDFTVADYTADELFGNYRKASVKHQGLTVPHWGSAAAT